MMRRALLVAGCVLAGGAVLPGSSWAAQPESRADALRIVRAIPVQHQGRLKPFDSFAREVLDAITGRPQLGSEDPVASVLSMIAEPEPWQRKALIEVPFVPLRELLGMDRRATHISYDELVATRRLMRQLPAIVEKQQRDEKLTLLENETMDAFQRFVTFNGLIEQRLALIPPPPGSVEVIWRQISPSADGGPAPQHAAARASWQALLEAWRAGNAQQAAQAAARLADQLAALNPAAQPARWRLRLELTYNAAQPFRAAQWCYLFAALALAANLSARSRRARPAGLWLLVGAFAVHAAGIAARVVLGGRPPVSNFFETMLWLPFVGVLLALVFERIYLPAPHHRMVAGQAGRAGYFGLAASILAAITLLLADFVPLDSSIAPVVAVLRSNLWLTIHVLTIVASYGALALATVLAHLYGVQFLIRRPGRAATRALDLFLYRTIQVGVVLLAGGIMLGAVWANASWGRYWGWDPKETWALITLLWYLALLHGRFAGWIRGVWVAVGTILGFYLLLITYYGVSFYLVGLHSYAGGHAKPLPPLLLAYLIAESAFLLVLSLSALRRQRLV